MAYSQCRYDATQYNVRCCIPCCSHSIWWRHKMETFVCVTGPLCGKFTGHRWNSPVTGEFPAQRPVTRSFDVFIDLRLNKRLSKRSWGLWSETPSHSLWRHCNETITKSKFAVTKTPHISSSRASYGVPIVWIVGNIDRVTTAPHCIKRSEDVSPSQQKKVQENRLYILGDFICSWYQAITTLWWQGEY